MSSPVQRGDSSRRVPGDRASRTVGPTEDSSKLSRKPSHRFAKPPIGATSRHSQNPSTSSAKKTSSRAAEPEQSSGLRKDGSSRRTNPRTQSATSNLSRTQSHYTPTPIDPSKLRRTESHREEEISAEEKEERRKRRNRENARRTRERRKSERKVWQNVYDANEMRIKELEKMVDELSGELKRHNTISDARPSSSGRDRRRQDNDAFEVEEDRPNWFGAAF